MSTPTNHWKVGLFVVSGVVLALCALVFLGVESLRNEHVVYHSYFDEPVQGLDIGSPIHFRGVKVGQVADIGIGPDRRHVSVACALFTKNLRALGLLERGGAGQGNRIAVPSDLRIQLVSQGLTGLKALQLDFFDVETHPAPALPFPVPENYIPAAVSTLKRLETSVSGAVDRFPEMVDALLGVTSHADRILDGFERAEIASGAAATLQRTNQLLASLQRALDRADLAGLSASARRTSDAIGDLASGSPVGEELVATLRELREAAASFRRLSDALERNPEMLLKGKGGE